MGKTKEGACDWIIFYNEGDGLVKRYVHFIAVGSKYIDRQQGTVLKGFHGTYAEAKAETDRLNREYERRYKQYDRSERTRDGARK